MHNPDPTAEQCAPGSEPDTSWRPQFRILWSAAVVSRFGDGLRRTMLPLLATQLTTSPLLISAISAVNYLPWLLFGLLGGALADRFDRKRTMWITDAMRGTVMAGFAVLVARGDVSIAILLGQGFLITSLQTVFDGASMALLPTVVPRTELAVANGKFSNARTIAENFIGAASAAYLFAIARALPFFADAASFLVAALLVARMRLRGAKVLVRRAKRLDRELLDGLAWLRRDRPVRVLCGVDWLMNLAMGLRMGVLVLQVDNYGLVLAISAVGGVAGGVLVGPLNRVLGMRRTLVGSLLLCALSLTVLIFCADYRVDGALLGLCYGGFIVWTADESTMVQSRVPAELRGRVSAANHTLSVTGIPVGSLVAGALAVPFGLASPDVLAALVLTVGAMLIFRAARPGTELAELAELAVARAGAR